MTDRIDVLLQNLSEAGPDRDLSQVERGVWAHIERERRDGFGGRGAQVQIAAACAALLLGFAISQLTGFSPMPRPLTSERIVLSDDAGLAPSVRLEGGV